MERSYNVNHPEKKSDEVFLTNADSESYDAIGWKTKRCGSIAYTINGGGCGKYPFFFPVFVKIKEIKKNKEGEKILKRLQS